MLRALDAESCLLWWAIIERTRRHVSESLDYILDEQMVKYKEDYHEGIKIGMMI